jgi:hypothetical protein
MNIPHLRFRPTPFMAEQIHRIALSENRSQGSVVNTLILEAIYARLSPHDAEKRESVRA